MEKGFAVTIGFFDGVHQGHRFLLKQLEALSVANNLRAAVVTFDCHPRSVLQKDFVPSLLTTQEEKLKLLSETFDGKIIVLPFTEKLSIMSAKEFMQNVLCNELNAKILLMGYNHRFGHGGGTTEEYETWGRETGIEVTVAKALEGEKISSSRIRNIISLGEIEKANSMLGYPYFLTGEVTEGKQIGRQIGFPTANLIVSKEKLLPACGVYGVWVNLPCKTKRPGMLCIGHRPTVEENGEISVEVHIFDYSANLYGTSISIDFIGKLRDERHFDSLEDLQKQLELDAFSARKMCSLTL